MLIIKIYYKNYTEKKKKIFFFKNEVTNNLFSFKISEKKSFSNDIIYFILGLLFHELFHRIYNIISGLIIKINYKIFKKIKKILE